MTPAVAFNPYPGLRPFRASEAHLFFGRSTHVDELLTELGRSRFVAVMGASASGKSSLVHAGLLPALHGGFAPRVGSHWRIASIRPGANPIHHLARALADPAVLGADDPDPQVGTAQVEAVLRRSAFGLADAARQSATLGDDRLLVVVDQFEELFRFRGDGPEPSVDGDAEPFVQLLIEATRDDEAPVDVIITMRSDFLGDCSRFRDLPETINHGLYLVPRLTRSQLREAVIAPAAVGGASISPRLAQRLLNDAGTDPDMLPVVQHALQRTWEVWAHEPPPRGPIDIQHYEACGGVESALSCHADEAYFALPDDRARDIAELMFERITELGDDHREVRRPTAMTEIAAVAEATPVEVASCAAHFEEQGRAFVTVSSDDVVDISHESLIRQWPRLRGWVREEADSRDQYRRLANAAGRWERGEAALLRDPELQIASRWWTERRPTEAWAVRYDPGFASAARYLERSRRAARRRRVGAAAGVVTLAVLAVAAGLLAVWANRQKADADQQRRTAVARQLASSSRDVGPAHRSEQVLAAVQAVRTTEQDGYRLAAAEEALRRAMGAPTGVSLASGEAPPGEINPVSTAISADGSVVATGAADGRVRLWDPDAPDAGPRVLAGEGAGIMAIALSDDGRWLAAGRDDGAVVLWDLSTTEPEPAPLVPHQATITSIAFGGPGPAWLATASRDGELQVQDLRQPPGQPPGQSQHVQAHDGVVHALAFSDDGTRIVTGGGDHVARVWTTGDLSARPDVLNGHDDGVLAVAFRPDGRAVATGSADGTARLWELDDPDRPVTLAPLDRVNSVAFSADGRRLATGSDDHFARVWDLAADGLPVGDPALLPHDDVVEAVAFSRGGPSDAAGHRLATASGDGAARVFDLDHPGTTPEVLAGHTGPVETVAFGGGDRWLVTGGVDGTARLWDLIHPVVQPVALPHGTADDGTTVQVAAVAFSPDGRTLATGASDKAVRLWEVQHPDAVPATIEQPTVTGFERAGVAALAYSRDGTLATGSTDGGVRLWKPAAQGTVPVEVPVGAAVTALAYQPDGSRLAVAVRGDDVLLVDPARPSDPPTPLTGHEDLVTSVAFSHDGRTLATGSRDGTVRLWDPAEPDRDPQVIKTGDQVTAVAFRPDGRELAVGTGTTVQLRPLADPTARPSDELEVGAPVNGVAYDVDGHALVVAAGPTVQLWDLRASGSRASVVNPVLLRDHTDEVTSVAVSPDGRHFATASRDGTARLWLWLDPLVDLACRTAGRNLTQAEWRQLLPGDTYRATCPDWPPGEKGS